MFTEALLGGLGALIVLAFVFGSFLAVIPLLMAIVAIPTTFLLVWGLASATDVSFIVQFLIALIGLGVSIDYSLLVVLRWREERLHGLQGDAAVQRAMETSGAAVAFSGTTVAVGLLALIALPVPFLRSVGYGGMLIPLVSVAVAITLLPVLLASIGPRLDWPRRERSEQASRFWAGWARLIVRRRWAATVVALVILAALISPLGRIVVGDPSADSLAKGGDARVGLVALEQRRHRTWPAGHHRGAVAPRPGPGRPGQAARASRAPAAWWPRPVRPGTGATRGSSRWCSAPMGARRRAGRRSIACAPPPIPCPACASAATRPTTRTSSPPSTGTSR